MWLLRTLDSCVHCGSRWGCGRMHYRKLTDKLVRFLESQGNDGQLFWPKYRPLKVFSIRNQWAFSEREYSRLRKVHIGAAGLVTSVAHYLAELHADKLAASIPELSSLPVNQWLDELTHFTDGSGLRKHDYYRSVTWKELPLLYMLRDADSEENSFCRDEETARRIAYAQYIEIARVFVPRHQWKNDDIWDSALTERIGHTASEFVRLNAACWEAVPECVWLTFKRSQLIGGSIVLPLTSDAYNRFRSGDLHFRDLSPERDMQLPSRDLFIGCMTIFPEIKKPRVPGVRSALQLKKLNQHGAILIGRDSVSDQPVRVMAPIGSPNDEKSMEMLGYTRLERNLKGSTIPLFEMIMPAPEKTVADFSSAAATMATILGTSWRQLSRD